MDRISRCPTILSEKAVPIPGDFDLNEHINTSFRMFNSEHQTVELICDNLVMDSIIDRFGEDIRIFAHDMNSFRIEVNISVNHVFFSWVFGFNGRVKINSPESVRQDYIEIIKSEYSNYEL